MRASLNNLQELVRLQSVELGYRPAGSATLRKLFDELVRQLQRYSPNCRIYHFPIRYLDPIRVSIRVGAEEFYALPYVGCPPFYPLQQVGKVCGLLKLSEDRLANSPDNVTGWIVLTRLKKESICEQIEHWRDRGARGVIFISPQDKDANLLNLISPIGDAGIERLQALAGTLVVTVSEETAGRLQQLALEGSELTIDTEVRVRDGTGRNIIIEVGNGEHVLDVVTHLDSPFERYDIMGAEDNASGVAVLMEVIRVLCEGAMPLNGKARFIFYDSEEYNLYGSLSVIIDLVEYLSVFTLEDLATVLRNPGTYPLDFPVAPQHILEIDTVGLGRELRYCTNSPARAVAILHQMEEMEGLTGIKVSQDVGNIHYLRNLLGIHDQTIVHYLTLGGVEKIIHTPLDTFERVNWDDIEVFANFLINFVIQLLS